MLHFLVSLQFVIYKYMQLEPKVQCLIIRYTVKLLVFLFYKHCKVNSLPVKFILYLPTYSMYYIWPYY